MVPAGTRGLAGEGPPPGRGHRQLRCPARLRPGHARGVWSWTMPPRVRASRGFPGRHEGGGPGAPPLCRSEQQGCRFGFTWLVRCWSQARSQVRRGCRCGAAQRRRASCVVRRASYVGRLQGSVGGRGGPRFCSSLLSVFASRCNSLHAALDAGHEHPLVRSPAPFAFLHWQAPEVAS